MTMKRIKQNSMQLRQQAEAQLAHATKLKPRPAEELLYELQVHQIELEMQNEHLRQAQVELEESRDRYLELYEFSPVGYLTLSHEGMIDEINLTGATLLGVVHNKLPHKRFAPFVAPEEHDRWYLHFLNVLKCDDILICELALLRSDESRFCARLDCRCFKKDGKKSSVRIALTDITERKQAESLINEQLNELRRWQDAMQGREMCVLELKHEVNGLLGQAGQPLRYPSAEQLIAEC